MKPTSCFIVLLFLVSITMSAALCEGATLDNAMNKEFEASKRNQDEFQRIMREARGCVRQGDFKLAEKQYLKALLFAENSSSEAVIRGELSEYYENVGLYGKAYEQVLWFLERLKVKEPMWNEFMLRQARLLRKIEERKKRGSGDAKTYQNPNQSSHSQQRKFIESMKTQGVATTFKEAALLELAGKFAEARDVYEKLLLQKEMVSSEMTLESWAMLYPAIQRTSELVEDEKREKEALVWIRDQMLLENGLYHGYLRDLLPPVQEHLRMRLKKFNLNL